MSNRMTQIFVVLLIVCFLPQWVNCGIFDFFWNKKDDASNTGLRKIPQVPFELPEQDQEFLKMALKITGSSSTELDQCMHRVIMKLDQQCNQLSTEDLGKLAVMLMNCQLVGEGRSSRMFSCTPEMTLKQCTIGMDATHHNLYHTFLNRVHATCMSKRHEQFRGLSEITVNNLMKTALEQLDNSRQLIESQIRLNEMAQDNIREIDENDVKIKSSQMQFLDLTRKGKNLVESSLKELTAQKDFIKMIKNDLTDNRNTLNKDTDDLKKKLEDTILLIEEQSEKISVNYEKTMTQLREINGLIEIVNALKTYCDNFKKFVCDLGIDVNDENFNIVAVYTIYLFFGMIILSFLGVSTTVRMFFMSSIGLNILAHVYSDGVTLLAFNNLFLSTWAVMSFINWISKKLVGVKWKIPNLSMKKAKDDPISDSDDNDNDQNTRVDNQRYRSVPPPEPVNSTNSSDIADNEVESIENNMTNQLIEQDSLSPTSQPRLANSYRSPTPLTSTPLASTLTLQRLMSMGDGFDRSLIGTPFIPGMAGRIQCQSLTQKGILCKNAATVGFNFCRVHNR